MLNPERWGLYQGAFHACSNKDVFLQRKKLMLDREFLGHISYRSLGEREKARKDLRPILLSYRHYFDMLEKSPQDNFALPKRRSMARSVAKITGRAIRGSLWLATLAATGGNNEAGGGEDENATVTTAQSTDNSSMQSTANDKVDKKINSILPPRPVPVSVILLVVVDIPVSLLRFSYPHFIFLSP